MRREKFRQIGKALTALDAEWAERRGELVGLEYRGVKSADETRSGPRTLQIVPLYDRRVGKRRPATIEEQEAQREEAELRWEFIKAVHGIP